MPTLKRFLLLLPLCAIGCGGGNVYFDDDEGAARQPSRLFEDTPDHLSLPYARGTKVRIAISGGKQDLTGWQVRSAAPAVLTVDKLALEEKRLIADCSALGEGATTLKLLDSAGAEQRTAAITVKAADRARILAHGPLRVLGREESSFASAEVREARILVGSRAVFALGYYRGEERLYGRGIATTDPLPQLTVENRTTSGVATNEWLSLHPLAAGSSTLRLLQGGQTLLTLPVLAVPEAEVTQLALSEEKTADRREAQEVWILAQAKDAMGRDIHGVYSDWTLAGTKQVGQGDNSMKLQGDLYRYKFASAAAPQELVATRGAARAALSIRAAKGYVADTTYLGCSAAPGNATPGAGGLLLLLLALFRRFSVRKVAALRG